ncbi:Nascent polypeptide-associated complex subunit beta [Cladochytrium tenue]|nr:Nascent polypeptide-associated complex subunit beta [Cladochytrium tenue]
MNPEKLAKLQAAARIGGKGTPRRKVKKVVKSSGADDKKLQATLKKFNPQPVGGIEEVNMFKADGTVLHFPTPRVQASLASSIFIINGQAQQKEITDLVPGILNQMGSDSLAQLRRMAEALQAQQAASGATPAAENDDEVPDLVENFDTNQ